MFRTKNGGVMRRHTLKNYIAAKDNGIFTIFIMSSQMACKCYASYMLCIILKLNWLLSFGFLCNAVKLSLNKFTGLEIQMKSVDHITISSFVLTGN